MECHEVWTYDDEAHIQHLTRLIALCPACHLVKHLGSAIMRGQGQAGFAHLARVNGWNFEEAKQHFREALNVWKARSEHDWTLDLEGLRNYGIDPDTIELASSGEDHSADE